MLYRLFCPEKYSGGYILLSSFLFLGIFTGVIPRGPLVALTPEQVFDFVSILLAGAFGAVR